jgi:hypothetical protein
MTGGLTRLASPPRLATWVAVVWLPLALSGCPLSDDYFVQRGSGGDVSAGGGSPVAGASGTGSAFAGSSAISGGSAGTSGTGGFAAGGVGASGGSAGANNGGVTSAGSSQGGAAAAGTAGDTGEEPNAGAGGEPSECEPSAELCDGISNDCDNQVDEDGVCPSDCSARTYGEQTYVLCMSASAAAQSNYSGASARCEALGQDLGLNVEMALAQIESAEENSFIKSWIVETTPGAGMIWIGANDLDAERTWVWGRGRGARRFFDADRAGGGVAHEDRFHDFAEGRPNAANQADEDCGALDSEVAWQWNDLRCSEPRLGFVCEPVAN